VTGEAPSGAASRRGEPPERPGGPRIGYWSQDAAALFTALDSSAAGLSERAAADRLESTGPNALDVRARAGAWRLALRQFESPLVLILVFAALVAALVQDWTNAAIVLAIVFGSALLSFSQEYRASKSLEKLRARVATRTTVLREGAATRIPSERIVPGDVVVLGAGSLIPADGVVLEAKDLFVTQSALTGETLPVEKQCGVTNPHASLAERTNCLFMGTSVRSGTGRMLIVRTAGDTVYGAIAARLRLRPPETDFERGIRRYGQLLTQSMTFLVLLVFAANVFLARPPVESLLFAIALAVGISPELLPAIISVTLSAGARDMAIRGVIVRRLSAIENLGSMNVLCTDKTGTLTEGSMVLEATLDSSGEPSRDALLAAFVNASLQAGLENPLDEAIAVKGRSLGLNAAAYRKLDEVPYDFVRKRLTIVVAEVDRPEPWLISKGAFANVLEVCTSVRVGATENPLDDDARARLNDRFAAFSAAGQRVLGLATKRIAAQPSYGRADESELVFAGFLLFSDPPKPEIEATLESLRRLGVEVKIITGDNRLVTEHLGRAVGFGSARVVTGRELNELREEALVRLAPQVDFFVEVDPNQKERIILALKKAGHVVGYLGDGINDASALHAADVGVSVQEAVDVAKEAADFVLLESNLDVLRRGVEQGRRTFANTLKYIAITTSANFGNMLSMAAASLFLPFLPLLAKQILLNNFLSDFPSMSIAGDQVDPEMVERPQRWNIRGVRNFTIVFGAVSSLFDFVTFGVLLTIFRADAEMFRTGWFFESLMTELLIVLLVRTRRPFYRSRPASLLLWSTVAVMAVTFVLPYLPFAGPLGFVPLSAAELAALTSITLAYGAASELTKRVFYHSGRAVAGAAAS
jgi:Mg2+-importing ATPase